MRIALAAALLIELSSFSTPADAQSRADSEHRSTDEVFKPSIGLPLPQIGLPLPQIGLPPPSMGLPPRTERFERPERPERSRGGSVVFFGPVFWPYPYLSGTPQPSAPSPAPPQRATGRLHLDLQSGGDPQIFVDGYYAGLFSDSNGELTLDAGAHVIELREDGYQTLHVDVQVPVDGVITYRAALKPLQDRIPNPESRIPAATPPPPPGPTTIYVIPGCYVGNVPPQELVPYLPCAFK